MNLYIAVLGNIFRTGDNPRLFLSSLNSRRTKIFSQSKSCDCQKGE